MVILPLRALLHTVRSTVSCIPRSKGGQLTFAFALGSVDDSAAAFVVLAASDQDGVGLADLADLAGLTVPVVLGDLEPADLVAVDPADPDDSADLDVPAAIAEHDAGLVVAVAVAVGPVDSADSAAAVASSPHVLLAEPAPARASSAPAAVVAA